MTDNSQKLVLDGTKISWHAERVEAWMRGERIAPVTIDMALTRACNYACQYCYSAFQENENSTINREHIISFLDDCAELGVKGISLVSDGESTLSPFFVETVEETKRRGLSIAVGTNGYALNETKLRRILPHLDYLRVNITAGEPKRYSEIMGVSERCFHRVCQNIETMVRLKAELNLRVTIGLQMVLLPAYADQILPLATLGKRLGVDYLVIKHCSDNERRELGVNYGEYQSLRQILELAESYSDSSYQVSVKWSKIMGGGTRCYERCYGPPFILQISGSGLVAPCGMLFNERYERFHIGNITRERFRDIIRGDRYWEVINYLASGSFNAQKICGTLCLQHKVNEYLDAFRKGQLNIAVPTVDPPAHLNFI